MTYNGNISEKIINDVDNFEDQNAEKHEDENELKD